MKLCFLGACNEVGRSSVWVKGGEVRLLLDAGIKVHDHNEVPAFARHACDAAIITHAHLDHSGAAPALYKNGNPPAFCTPPTEPVVQLLLQDSDKLAEIRKKPLPYSRAHAKQFAKKTEGIGYNQEYEFHDGSRFSLLDAGHIPGSAQVLYECDNKRLLYTGDWNLEETRLQSAAALPDEHVNVLVTESTYGMRDHPPRAKLEREFCDAIALELESGNRVLVPCFAVGRTQEILQVLDAGAPPDAQITLAGMGAKVNDIIAEFPGYVRDPRALGEALARATVVNSAAEAKRASKKPGIAVATAGMLDGGPMLTQLKEANKHGNAVVFLTGYQVKGTNGRMLVEEGRMNFDGHPEPIKLAVRQFDFSAHAGRKQLFARIKKLNPEKVFCVHGDDCAAFAADLRAQGFDAVAPKTEESFTV
ncbi:MAG: MBL fold metallo-hydrolase [Candidatus Micrarchaeia archaeon]